MSNYTATSAEDLSMLEREDETIARIEATLKAWTRG